MPFSYMVSSTSAAQYKRNFVLNWSYNRAQEKAREMKGPERG